MAKKVAKTKKNIVKTKSVKRVSGSGLDHDFIIIAGGGFILIIVIMMLLGR